MDVDNIVISCPASTSNIGTGFDTIGIALNLRNEFYCELSFCYQHFSSEHLEKDLFYEAYKKSCETFGSFIPIKVRSKIRVPQCSGLGSSATAVISGIIAGSIFNGIDYNKELEKIMELAFEIEGHLDNVSACFFGNCVAVINKPYTYNVFSSNYSFLLFYPYIRTKTDESRKELPLSYSREDVVFSIQRSSLLIEALKNGNTQLLKELVKDKIHQPYRLHNIKMLEELMSLSDLPCFLSGSGPTIAVIYNKNNEEEKKKMLEIEKKMKEKAKKWPITFKTYKLDIAKKGVVVKKNVMSI
jgi:homoserine kinase